MAFFIIIITLIISTWISPSFSFLPRTKNLIGISTRRHLALKAVKGIKAREIIDSRGNPTIEVDVTTELGTFSAPVPSGASTGAYEACELRDEDMNRFHGKGVLKAVNNVNHIIANKLIGIDPSQQTEADQMMIELDGTDNKSNLGANAILAVSIALCKAGAAMNHIPLYQHIANLAGNDDHKFTLPTPSFNVINGGSHAGNKLAFQEYFVIPAGAESFTEAMQIGCEVYHTLAKVIKSKYGGDATLIGDEGGFAPPCDERSGLDLIMESLSISGHSDKCFLGLDIAASEFKVKNNKDNNMKNNLYNLDFKNINNEKNQYEHKKEYGDSNMLLNSEELMIFYDKLIHDFPKIISIEDPFDEDDWPSWTAYNTKWNTHHHVNGNNNGNKLQIVADDLTVTNPIKIKHAIKTKAANTLLLKCNQIGTLTESINAVKMAKQAGWGVMTSHRSGETCDSFISDLAVGLCTGQIKSGAPCRSERLSKYNRLMKIEEELGTHSTYAGKHFHTPSWMGN